MRQRAGNISDFDILLLHEGQMTPGDRATSIVERNLGPMEVPGETVRRLRDEIASAIADAVREALAPYRYRPIGQIHEDYGACVLMNINDPGYLDIGTPLDLGFEDGGWTHFAEIPKLTNEDAAELKRLWTLVSAARPEGNFAQVIAIPLDRSGT